MGVARKFCWGMASHWRRQGSIFSYFAQRSFRFRSLTPGRLHQDMTSNIFYQLATYSWNLCKAPAKNLRMFVSWGHGLFRLILAALLPSPEHTEENLSS